MYATSLRGTSALLLPLALLTLVAAPLVSTADARKKPGCTVKLRKGCPAKQGKYSATLSGGSIDVIVQRHGALVRINGPGSTPRNANSTVCGSTVLKLKKAPKIGKGYRVTSTFVPANETFYKHYYEVSFSITGARTGSATGRTSATTNDEIGDPVCGYEFMRKLKR